MFLEKLKWMQHPDFDLLSSWLVVVYYSCSCASLKEEELQTQACSLFLLRGKHVINMLFQSEMLSVEQPGCGFSFPLYKLGCAVSVRKVLSLQMQNVKA